jgi:hypothetical protein
VSRGRSSKLLPLAAVAFLTAGIIWAGSGCGDKTPTTPDTVPTQAVVQSAAEPSTTTTEIDPEMTPAETNPPALSSTDVRKVLDQLREAAGRASFTVYHLGEAYDSALIAGVMAGDSDSNGAPRVIDIVYRRENLHTRLVIYLSQYDPTLRPDLKKPLADWTLVQEVGADDHNDAIYLGGSPANALFYVTQRGSTEISLAGYTRAGYLTQEQLIDIAPLLIPVL